VISCVLTESGAGGVHLVQQYPVTVPIICNTNFDKDFGGHMFALISMVHILDNLPASMKKFNDMGSL